MAKMPKQADLAQKRFEINQLFTPSTPVTVAELFAGRLSQILRIMDTIPEIGRHAVIYGERGVGKTSLMQVVPFLVPDRIGRVRFCRVQAFPDSTFHSLFNAVFKKIKFTADVGDGEQEYSAADVYNERITPDDVVTEFSRFTQNDIPIVVLDEFNEITDSKTPKMVANTIKALSDAGTNVTIMVVGVADNVTQLIENHESVQRCTEEILMPRMTADELWEVLNKRLKQLGFTITPDGKWKIINLAKGLPAYVHALGKHACLSTLGGGRLHLEERHVDAAIDALIASSDRTFKDIYEAATRSAQPDNLLRHVLTACALAKVDDSGYFRPAAPRLRSASKGAHSRSCAGSVT
jgi:Cdc6-like AAA superfamily ATPase